MEETTATESLLSTKKSINSPMEPYIVVIGKLRCAMAKALRSGQMELDMKACGELIKLMEKESSGMWMEIYSKESGKTTRQTDMVSIPT